MTGEGKPRTVLVRRGNFWWYPALIVPFFAAFAVFKQRRSGIS